MKFKVGDRVRYAYEVLVSAIQIGNECFYTGLQGFEITQINGEEVRSEDGLWFHEDHLEPVPEEPEFEYGEEIEVSDDGEEWEKRIYLATVGSREKFYICVSEKSIERYKSGLTYNAYTWEYARKLKPQLTRKEIAEKFGVSEDFTLVD